MLRAAHSRKRVRAFDYVFIYLSTLENFWRTSTMRINNATRTPIQREDERGHTRTRSLYKYDVYYMREEEKRKKGNLVKLLSRRRVPIEKLHAKSVQWHDQYIHTQSLCCV